MATTGNDESDGRLEEILSRRIMLLDGSMGALIYTHELNEEAVSRASGSPAIRST